MVFQFPKPSGRSRHGQPARVRKKIPLITGWQPAESAACGPGTGRPVWTGHERAVLRSRRWVYKLAIAPDGTWLATGGIGKTVRIWDTASGRMRGVLRSPLARTTKWMQVLFARFGSRIIVLFSGISQLAIAPDGTWLATGSWEGSVQIWDAVTRQERAHVYGHHGPVRTLAIAPDGTWLATGDRESIRIRDPANGKERAVIFGQFRTVAIAPDSAWLATGGADGSVRIWDAATGQERMTLAGHPGEVHAVAVAPDGTWLATAAGGGSVRIWDAATGQERAALHAHNRPVQTVTIARDGTWLATGTWKGVQIWDTATGQDGKST